jgi:hypothetical protein
VIQGRYSNSCAVVHTETCNYGFTFSYKFKNLGPTKQAHLGGSFMLFVCSLHMIRTTSNLMQIQPVLEARFLVTIIMSQQAVLEQFALSSLAFLLSLILGGTLVSASSSIALLISSSDNLSSVKLNSKIQTWLSLSKSELVQIHHTKNLRRNYSTKCSTY